MRTPVIRRMLCLLCCLLIAAVFSSCGKEDEYGDIKHVAIEDSYETVETDEDGTAPDDPFRNYENKLGYKYKTLNVGRGKFKIPYPASWTVSKRSDYNICFDAPADDPHFPGERIWLHSTFQTEDIYNHLDVLPEFDRQIQSDTFQVGGASYSMLPSSKIDKVFVDSEIADPNFQYEMSYRDWDPNTRPSSGKTLYHQTTTFYWLTMPFALTGMTSRENADELNDLILYMMSNLSYITDRITDGEETYIFEDTQNISFKLSPLFRPVEGRLYDQEGYFNNIAEFYCPADSGTGFSQISLAIYEVKKKDWHDITEEDDFKAWVKEPLLINTFGEEVSRNASIADVYAKTGGQAKLPDRTADEYMYNFTMHDYFSELYFDGQNWMTEFWVIENGDYMNIYEVTGPEDSLTWMLDIASSVGSTMTFGGDK